MTIHSALYVGNVLHHRLRPKQHRLKHRVYWLLLDLDEIEALSNRLWLFSYNKANLLSLFDKDHGDDTARALRDQMADLLDAAGVPTEDIKIALLCMPRVLGYDFNPISVYYCYRSSGEAIATIYEVNNTFHQRHTYVCPIEAGRDDGAIDQTSSKNFYVSPFLDLNMSYAFRTALPGDEAYLSVRGLNGDGPIINTSLRGVRKPLTDWQLLRVFITHPLLPLKVVAAIHWHALRMWLKGFRLQDQPPTPTRGSTIVKPNNRGAGA